MISLWGHSVHRSIIPGSYTILKWAITASPVTDGETEDKKENSYSESRIPFFHQAVASCSKGKAKRREITLAGLYYQSKKKMGGFVPGISALTAEVCLSHFNTTCFPFILTLVHPDITPYFNCLTQSPCFPQRRGSKQKLTWAQERAQSRTRVWGTLWLTKLKYRSVVSSALEAVKRQAAEHKHVVMTMSVIKNSNFSAWLMHWGKGNQDGNKHLIEFTALRSTAAESLKCNNSRDKLSVIDEMIPTFLSVLLDTSALVPRGTEEGLCRLFPRCSLGLVY